MVYPLKELERLADNEGFAFDDSLEKKEVREER